MNYSKAILPTIVLLAAVPSPSRYQTYDRIEIVGRYYMTGIPQHNSAEKKVWIDYNAFVSGPNDARLASSTVATAVPYTPTATAVVDSTHVVVAGTTGTSGTETLIELWTITQPSLDLVSNPTTGTHEYIMTPASITSQSSIFRADVAGQRTVQRLIKLRGRTASVLVQFMDSHDLYELDYTSTPSSLIRLFRASASGSGTQPVVPDLAHEDLTDTRGRRHKSQGFLYLLMPPVLPEPELQGASQAIVFVDSNCDGTIDTWLHVTPAMLQSWYAEGYVEIDLATRW